MESGRRRNLRPSTLSALAAALGVTIDYLVSGAASQPMLEHRALLYGTDADFLAAAAAFLSEAVDRSEAAIAVISTRHIAAVKEELGSRAGAIRFEDQASWYGTPVGALNGYRTFLNSSLEAGAPWVRILGEPAWAGRPASEVRSLCRYESLLNLVFAAAPVTVLCPYDTRTVDEEVVGHARTTHPHTVEGERLTRSATYADPGTFVLEP